MTFRDPIRFLRQCQLAACVAAAVVGPLAGCQMRPVPLSAQAGSTIALPLDWLRTPAAHGGTEYDDPQRGELVFALGAPVEQGGLELTTRVTLALAGSVVELALAAPATGTTALSYGLSADRGASWIRSPDAPGEGGAPVKPGVELAFERIPVVDAP